MRVLLFDLDETIIIDHNATLAAFKSTAALVTQHHLIDPAKLAVEARRQADLLWQSVPVNYYCTVVGISPIETMFGEFSAADPNIVSLREWSKTFRVEVWVQALKQYAIEDYRLAKKLAQAFSQLRRELQSNYTDVAPALDKLASHYRFGLITNGASCLQRQKFQDTGLAERFEYVCVSGDLGFGKPDPRIFQHALSQMGVTANEACMIGDNPSRDIAGAIAAGVSAICVNRHSTLGSARHPDKWQITSFEELPATLLDLEKHNAIQN